MRGGGFPERPRKSPERGVENCSKGREKILVGGSEGVGSQTTREKEINVNSSSRGEGNFLTEGGIAFTFSCKPGSILA